MSESLYVNMFMKEFDTVLNRQLIRVVLDIGSRDAKEAIALKEYFPAAAVYTFECNPACIELCEENIDNRPGIILVDKAISDENGPVDFYAINTEKTISTRKPDKTIGASSLFVANPAYPHETYYQDKITVEAITLKRWAIDNKIETVDLVWMDLQGSELKALKGMGNLIDTVSVIYTEVEYQSVYLNQPLFDEIDEYLALRGFRAHAKMNTSAWFGDVMYIREDNS